MAEPYRPPADTGLDLVHEDEWLLVLNKPAGLLSVPGRGADKQDSLAHRVQSRYPGARVVHRLDMETSGLLLMARDRETQRLLGQAFEHRQVGKRYSAVVAGLVSTASGSIELPLIADWPNRPRQKVDKARGKPALTHYRVLARDTALQRTRISLTPVTGRSHQLRVHLQSIGHPIIGDRLYAIEQAHLQAERLLLHAERLSLRHPRSGEPVAFHCPCPF